MKRALLLLAAVLPLAAQPKLLLNAQTDTRSAAAGLEREYRTLLAADPQPAWIGYSVPAIRTASLGCDYVRDSNATAVNTGARARPRRAWRRSRDSRSNGSDERSIDPLLPAALQTTRADASGFRATLRRRTEPS